MRRSSQVALIVFALILLGGGWAAYYVQDKGFTHRWRDIVTDEFAKRGVHATIRRLNLDPLRGLIAKDVLIYEDPAHQNLLMRISQIALDIDVSEFSGNDFSLRAFEIRNATITIPLDPSRRLRGDKLVLDNFSARVLMPPDQIEIVRAEASIQGIVVALSGSLFRPPEPPGVSEEDKPSLGKQQRDRLAEMRQRREQIASFLLPLQEIEFDPGSIPRIELQVQGDTANLAGVRVNGTIRSGGFTYRTYKAQSLSAVLRYERDTIVVRELEHIDAQGKLQAELEFDLPNKDLRFQVTSTADALGLLRTIHPMPILNEVVFYEPPLVEASGTYHLSQPFSWDHLPIEVIGKVRTERMTSRGVIFEAMSGNFSADGNKLYLRNGKVEHKTGVMTCDLLKDEDGVRFMGDIRLHPTIFGPFVVLEGSRQFLKQWDLNDQSAVFIKVEGHGETLSPESWITTGVVDLRNCQLNGHPIEQLQCDLYFEKKIHNFFNVAIRRPEGEITGEHIRFDHEAETCTFHSVRGRVFPTHAVGWFAPDVVQELVVYEFDTPPQLSVEGTLDFRPPSEFAISPPRHDYFISFQSDSSASYAVLGKEIELWRPSGTVLIQGDTVTLRNFQADALQGKVHADVTISNVSQVPAYDVQIEAEHIDFQQLAQTYGSLHETTGSLSGMARFRGDQPGVEHLKGGGTASIQEGNIFCLPAFGPFSKILSATLPKLHDGFSVAREVDVKFRLADGLFVVDQFLAETGAFHLKGDGTVGLEDQALDFETTLNLKGPAGALLVPVSKLLEYEARGTLSEPLWRAKNLAKVKDATLDNITETTAGALRRVGEALPKRLQLRPGHSSHEPAPPQGQGPSTSPPMTPGEDNDSNDRNEPRD